MNIAKVVRNPRMLYERRSEIAPRLVNAVLRFGYRLGIVIDRNGRAIQALKNIHHGRRAFIIGNGPSLQIADLDALRHEITFASNKIYLAFDKTEWRPTYYSVSDGLVACNNRKTISQLPLKKIFSHLVAEYFEADQGTIWLWESPSNLAVLNFCDGTGPSVKAKFSENALICVHGGWSIVYTQLQLAYFMGIREVILIGVDFSFSVPETRKETNVRGYGVQIESKGEVNHFHPDYRKPGESWSIPRLDCMRLSYRSAREAFQRQNGRVINASRKTELEVFERASLDSLLGN